MDYIRRKSFGRKDEFTGVGQANEHLLQSCEKLNATGQILKSNQTAGELLEDGKNNLFIVQCPYKCFEGDHAKVDKYSTISYKKNRYSVPGFLVGRLLDLKIFAEKIDIYFNGEQVSSHTRSYGPRTWEMDISHCPASLGRKPGALKGSLALDRLSEKAKGIRENYFDNDAKDFIGLPQYCKDKNTCFAEVENAVGKIKKITPTSISKDKILAVTSKEKELSGNKAGSTSGQQLKLGEIEEQSIVNLQNLTAAFN